MSFNLRLPDLSSERLEIPVVPTAIVEDRLGIVPGSADFLATAVYNQDPNATIMPEATRTVTLDTAPAITETSNNSKQVLVTGNLAGARRAQEARINAEKARLEPFPNTATESVPVRPSPSTEVFDPLYYQEAQAITKRAYDERDIA